jgi:endogenous inhibitor of DNA gyrase (YacG/DUF329 family)
MIDLGEWIDESRRIPAEDEELPSAADLPAETPQLPDRS